MTIVQRMLRRMLVVTTASPVVTVLVALALCALAVTYTVRNLEFQTSQKDLISPENRLVKLAEGIDQFDDLDTFVVAIENRDRARSIRFLKALVKRVEGDHDHFLQAFYRVDPKAFRPWALLYLKQQELADLRNTLSEHRDFIRGLAAHPGLVTFFQQLNKEMTSRMVGELFTGFLDDESSSKPKKPLDLTFLMEILKQMNERIDAQRAGKTLLRQPSPWRSFFSGDAWQDDPDDSYFWTDNKHFLLLFVTPRKEDSGFSNAYPSLLALRNHISALKARFPGIRAGVTGQEALNEDEMGAAMKDMSVATGLSLVSLTALLIFFWRGVKRPLLEITELLMALSCTFGLTTLFIGHLNILSVTFAPLLLGLGIDYGIHWFARYQEIEAVKGAVPRQAVLETMIRLGPGVLLAGITAALSFFPLVLTGFKGLVELGIIATMGMLMTTITTLCVLPSLTLLFDRPRQGSPPVAVRSAAGFRFNDRRAALVLVPAVALLLAAGWQAQKVSFDLNMLRLQSQRAESVIWEKNLLSDSKRSSMYGAILADSLEETRSKVRALKALPTVSEVQSVESLLPENQVEKLQVLRSMKPFLPATGPLVAPKTAVDIKALADVLGRIRFKMLDSAADQWGADKPLESQMVAVRRLISRIRERFKGVEASLLQSALQGYRAFLFGDLNDKLDILRANVNTRPMTISDLPSSLRQRFVSNDGRYLIRVFPAEDIWEPRLLGRFVHDLQSVDADAIGDPVTLYVFTKAFRNACIHAVLYAVLFVVVLLLATFRNLVETILVLIPLVAGTIWTVGLMGVFGVNFNLANTIFLPLVVGAGVEYGIILMQRLRQDRDSASEVVLPLSTTKGIVLAGLTTTVGFGSLTISSHQGIHSLGMLATVGSLSILAASILFLPSLIQLLMNSSRFVRWYGVPEAISAHRRSKR